VKIQDTIQLFRTELKDIYSAEEIENFIFFSMNEYLGYTRRHLQLKANQSLDEKETERFKNILSELKKYKPIQYILGNTEFYGMKIRVNENVLIPRPETEELVELILQENPSSENILDIGTGSGCIAISLKKHLPEATVSAIDISDEALLIAKENAILNHTLINFLQGDILKIDHSQHHDSFDIIVSNPPYVRQSEKRSMSKNVLDYEPHIALFIEDDDALKFYKAISDFALENLSENGKLYFEINEALGSDVKKLLEKKGLKNVLIKKDMSGKDRIVFAERK
jgi:release factor glutamine methyltransferase